MSRRIAFLLLLHEDPELAIRLCQRLSPHAVFVHVDAKAFDYPIARLQALANVTVIHERFTVFWASYAMTEAMFALLRAALAAGESFSRYMMLSGACYPLQPVAELAERFDRDAFSEFLQVVPVTQNSRLANSIRRHWRMKPLLSWQTLSKYFFLRRGDEIARRFLNKVSSFFPRKIEQETGEPIFFGSQWWALTEACAIYLLQAAAERPRLLSAARSAFAPDEIVFATIVGNSPFAAHIAGGRRDLGSDTLYDAPLHIIHPSVERRFGNSDADFQFAKGSGKPFMRKVSSRLNASLLGRVDRELLEPTPH